MCVYLHARVRRVALPDLDRSLLYNAMPGSLQQVGLVWRFKCVCSHSSILIFLDRLCDVLSRLLQKFGEDVVLSYFCFRSL